MDLHVFPIPIICRLFDGGCSDCCVVMEKEMAAHSSIFAWSSMDRGAWWATVHGVAESRPD